MSTQRTAQVYVTNTTDGQATITLYHNNSSNGTQQGTWQAAPGEQVGPLTVNFETGFGSWGILDYWALELVVEGGSTPGAYESSGVLRYSDWKECQLQGPDAGKNLPFTVDAHTFSINLVSGGCSTPMNLVERQTAQAYVTNSTDGTAAIKLFHDNSSDGTQSATWSAAPGATVGPLTVPFRVGLDNALILDYWALELAVANGSAPGIYQSTGFLNMTDWKECQLQAADSGQNLSFTADTHTFSINLPSGGCSAPMALVAPYTAISHVFVLMLENHSFDNMLGQSGIPGITHADPNNANSYGNQTYTVGKGGAPSSMPTDPGHEFLDTFEQLNGHGVQRTLWSQYPTTLNNSGFVSNYATTRTEITSNNPNLPTPAEYGEVMSGFDTPTDLPVTYQLATEFAVCDKWFASIPGPTFPNRFFVHGASSGGWADSPGSSTIANWLLGSGFAYPSGSSIYDAFNKAGLQYRFYADHTGSVAGSVPQVALLKGISYLKDISAFSSLATDLQGPYPYTYTFIEPNYGDVTGGSYTGGSSEHPMDGVSRGEGLIKATYEAIRNSPHWTSSMLIVTYDEHGGFYDSVSPGPAPDPDDGWVHDTTINQGGFLFDHYGIRVPAIVVSPWIPAATVDHTAYDHTSVLATLERLYGIPPLTARDAKANDLRHLLSEPTPRTDCPTTLHAPPTQEVAAPGAMAGGGDQPLPASGNVHGLLAVLHKTDLELARGDADEIAASRARFSSIATHGDADAYASEVILKAKAAQANRAMAPARRASVQSR